MFICAARAVSSEIPLMGRLSHAEAFGNAVTRAWLLAVPGAFLEICAGAWRSWVHNGAFSPTGGSRHDPCATIGLSNTGTEASTNQDRTLAIS